MQCILCFMRRPHLYNFQLKTHENASFVSFSLVKAAVGQTPTTFSMHNGFTPLQQVSFSLCGRCSRLYHISATVKRTCLWAFTNDMMFQSCQIEINNVFVLFCFVGSGVNLLLITPEKSTKLVCNDYFRHALKGKE